MAVFKISDSDLNNKIKTLVAEERKLTQNILDHIAEVDKRKLYLKMAYPSLFEYLTKEIGYSPSSAQRRIDAARLLQQIPEVSNKIQSGSLNLTQISKAQKVFREYKKVNNKPVHVEIKKEIIKKLENQGALQTDLILAKEFNIEIKTETKQIQKDESVRIELTFSKEEMELIKQAQSLLSHKTGGGLKDTLVAMAEKVVKQSVPKQNVVEVNKSTNAIINASTKANAGASASNSKSASTNTKSNAAAVVNVKTLTPKLRREIITRDKECQYKDHKTGKICGSRYFLEIDHIQPKFASGSNHSTNLRVLCKNHNIFRYQMGK